MKKIEFIKDLGMLYPTAVSKRKHRYSLYKCGCGQEFKVLENAVKSNRTKSCGCNFFIEDKGISKHPLYGTWYRMIGRTSNCADNRYDSYGGRGIHACERWHTFSNFIEDMYASYTKGFTLDRKDNDKGYNKGNCRWVDNYIQTQNIRLIKANNTSGYKGVSKCNRTGKWIARITNYGYRKYLGLFTTPELAYEVYCSFIKENNLEHSY